MVCHRWIHQNTLNNLASFLDYEFDNNVQWNFLIAEIINTETRHVDTHVDKLPSIC